MNYTKETSKEKIKYLTEQFDNEISSIMSSGSTNEAQIEDKYIKPLFSYLNWNIHNEGLSIGKEEFIVQYKHTTMKRKTKPDYLLRYYDTITNTFNKILFIEAKHPKIDILTDLSAIRQAYQYAHSTYSYSEKPENRVRLSLLTDFEQFRLFDCIDPQPIKNNHLDHYNRHIVKPFDWTYKNYITDFNLLWDTFEFNNVKIGSLNNLNLSKEDIIKSKKTPDIQFLNDLERWRPLSASIVDASK